MSDLRLTVLASVSPEDIEVLSDDAMQALARRLGVYLSSPSRSEEPDGWLDRRKAAAHLGVSDAALYKLTSARAVPFHQDGPGCKLWFKASELDEWRRRGGARGTSVMRRRAA